ncbi:hypothetical protein [Mesorhizobium sp. 43Arga]
MEDNYLFSCRGRIARIFIAVFIICIAFGPMSLVLHWRINSVNICWLRLPKFYRLDLYFGEDFCSSNDLLLMNLFVFSAGYAAAYIIAIPAWVKVSWSRKNWNDWRTNLWSIIFICVVFACIALEIHGYIFTDVRLLGRSPRLGSGVPIYEYSVHQVFALMGPVNFLLFAGSISLSGKIFGPLSGNHPVGE